MIRYSISSVANKKSCCGLFQTTMLNSSCKNHFSYKMLLEFPNLNSSTKFAFSCSIHFQMLYQVFCCAGMYTAVLISQNRSFEKHFFFWSIQKGLYVLFSNMFIHQRVLLTNNAKMSTLFSFVRYTYSLQCTQFGSWNENALLGLF